MRRGVCLAVLWALAVTAPSRGGDGVVALRTAAPSCADDSGDRYVACGNGTVTDNQTGLVWLADADCFSAQTWLEAMVMVAGLADLPASLSSDCDLDDGSSPGEWRLPSAVEWQSMIADADGDPGELDCTLGGSGGPSITDDAGTGCYGDGSGSSFVDVASAPYWSSSSVSGSTIIAWAANLDAGVVASTLKSSDIGIWPVRGGQ
jgi:hypothetical protein